FVTSSSTGTTWTQEIVWQIHNEGKVSKENIGRRVPFLEFPTVEYTTKPDFESLPSPRLIKSHLTADTIPKGSDKSSPCKYIYVYRNPKDVSMSFFFYLKGMAGVETNVENAFSDPCMGILLKGNLFSFMARISIPTVLLGHQYNCTKAYTVICRRVLPYSQWNDHVLSWWKHREDPNVLFLKYEDMQKDLPSHVRRIADFLQKPLSDEIIDRIAEQCTFKEMMRYPKTFKIIEGDDEIGLILRKGVVGDWKNYFTPEMNERFEKEVLAKLKGTGLEFEFEP
ncbi:amine sulfotransferase-like, partial [Acropora muricata]|uniref:amine sulfotransferase-like n=1 Tax=Acropora muricata TaxID=159855 RepID=UPI0034E59820